MYEMVAALATIQGRGVDVYVGGRFDGAVGRFVTMHDFLSASSQVNPNMPPLPARVHGMFHEIGEDEFREDLSSTQLREQQRLEQREKH